MIVEMTLQPGVSVARIAREHDLNANMVFKWRGRYRASQAKLQGLPMTSPSVSEYTGMLPVNVIDAPKDHTWAPSGAGELSVVPQGATPPGCEVEVEIGKRRVRVRGLSMDRAEQFLRECLR